MGEFAKVTVVYQVTYFLNGKPVVLTALDPQSFALAVEKLRERFPNRPLYLSSTCTGSN